MVQRRAVAQGDMGKDQGRGLGFRRAGVSGSSPPKKESHAGSGVPVQRPRVDTGRAAPRDGGLLRHRSTARSAAKSRGERSICKQYDESVGEQKKKNVLLSLNVWS